LLVIVLLRRPDTNEAEIVVIGGCEVFARLPMIVVIGGCEVFARLPASPYWMGIAEHMVIWRNAAIRGAWLAQRATA